MDFEPYKVIILPDIVHMTPVLKEKLEHTHTVPSIFKYDDENHWSECGKCGEKLNVTPHEWSSGLVTVEPTQDKEGVKSFSCVCGATRTESIEKLPKKEGGCSGSAPASLALVSLFVCAQAGVFFKKKKKF